MSLHMSVNTLGTKLQRAAPRTPFQLKPRARLLIALNLRTVCDWLLLLLLLLLLGALVVVRIRIVRQNFFLLFSVCRSIDCCGGQLRVVLHEVSRVALGVDRGAIVAECSCAASPRTHILPVDAPSA